MRAYRAALTNLRGNFETAPAARRESDAGFIAASVRRHRGSRP